MLGAKKFCLSGPNFRQTNHLSSLLICQSLTTLRCCTCHELQKSRNNAFVLHCSCGGGTANRTREHRLPGVCQQVSGFQCYHSTFQVQMCNLGCPNGGMPDEDGCQCQDGWKGICCKTRTSSQKDKSLILLENNKQNCC